MCTSNVSVGEDNGDECSPRRWSYRRCARRGPALQRTQPELEHTSERGGGEQRGTERRATTLEEVYRWLFAKELDCVTRGIHDLIQRGCWDMRVESGWFLQQDDFNSGFFWVKALLCVSIDNVKKNLTDLNIQHLSMETFPFFTKKKRKVIATF